MWCRVKVLTAVCVCAQLTSQRSVRKRCEAPPCRGQTEAQVTKYTHLSTGLRHGLCFVARPDTGFFLFNSETEQLRSNETSLQHWSVSASLWSVWTLLWNWTKVEWISAERNYNDFIQEMPALLGVPAPSIAAQMLTPNSEKHGRQKCSQHCNYPGVSKPNSAAASFLGHGGDDDFTALMMIIYLYAKSQSEKLFTDSSWFVLSSERCQTGGD